MFTKLQRVVLLFSTVRGSRPGKNVQLTETEIRNLCLKCREIFLSQPILLELEAPLKICGKSCLYFSLSTQLLTHLSRNNCMRHLCLVALHVRHERYKNVCLMKALLT